MLVYSKQKLRTAEHLPFIPTHLFLFQKQDLGDCYCVPDLPGLLPLLLPWDAQYLQFYAHTVRMLYTLVF